MPEVVLRAIDEGREGLFTIDLEQDGAAGQTKRLRAPDFSGGDAQFSFVYSDGMVAYRCSQGACSTPVARESQSSPIGDAWCIAPSAEPGRVWLAELDPVQKPKNRRDISIAREVDIATGTHKYASIDLKGDRLFCPVGSFAGGLLFQTTHLLAIGPEGVVARIDDVFPVATRGSLVASYDERGRKPVRRMRITDIETGSESWIQAPLGWRFVGAYTGGAISPDGRRIAALVSRTRKGIIGCANTSVVVADVRGGLATVIGPACGSMSFSADGRFLYAAGGPRRSVRYGWSRDLSTYRLTDNRVTAAVTQTGIQILHIDSDS